MSNLNQKTKYFAWISHTILFPCSKRCQIKLNTLFDYENQQQKRMQNIAINHSPDIDYNDFVRIYRECTKTTYSFWAINTTLPASDPLRLRRKLLPSYKNDSN